MESFALFRKHLAMSGIILQQAPHSLHSFNLKNSTVIVLASLLGISVAKQLDEANTFEEYIDVVYRVASVVMFILFYVNNVWKTPEMIRFVDRIEDSINNRM